MRNDTREQFNRYMARQARLNGVPEGTKQFTAEPSVQQTLESKLQESSAFLGLINMVGVDEQQGEKIGLGISSPIAARTNVSSNDRETTDVSALDDNGYECKSTEFDTHITWAQLDAWAKFPDFQVRLRDQVLRRQALDRIMIGFNGTAAASATNMGKNELLEDVNIGWLEKYRANAGSYALDKSDNGAADFTYGQGGTYNTLDALVFDLARSIIDPWYVDDPRIRVIIGRDLMHDKEFTLVDGYDQPTERNAADIILSTRRLGGYPAIVAPFFPAGTALITAPENLSLYWQRGSRRRYVEDNPRRKRIEHYDSSNDAYVVEDYGFGVLVEDISEYSA